MAGEIFNNCNLKTFVDFSFGRDDLGTSIALHTQSERRNYLKRNPQVDPKSLPEVRDPNRVVDITDSWGSVNGEPLRTPERIRNDAARNGALLRDPLPTRRAPTKPVAMRSSEQTVDVAYHEALHCAATLHNGVKVLRATIVREGDTDGLTTMVLDRKDCPAVHAFISLAAEVGNAWLGYPGQPEAYGSDRDVGGSLEWREAIREMVCDQLPDFIGGAMEIARKLIATQTLEEFEIKAAYVRGQRRAREEAKRDVGGISARRTPIRQRHFDFSKPEDVRAFNVQMGRDPNSEPIGYTQGYILNGGVR